MHVLKILLPCLILLCSCSDNNNANVAIPAAPVVTAPVEQGDMPRELEMVGNVRASASVAITPRVGGEIVAVNYTEGENVLAGESILEIDPRPYAAVLAERRAALAKSRAQLRKAQRDRSRYGKLLRDGFISHEAFDQTATDEAALAATVAGDEAALRLAELDLSFCSVAAPISGRIGELEVHKGNTVKANDSEPICTIDTISPCYVTFAVPEVHLPAILEQMRDNRLPVTATPVGGQPVSGTLTLVDNSVDTKTGAIRLRATFDNAQQRLWPGQFVEIKLPLGTLENALIVPARAIQAGRDEAYIYIVGKDDKAEYRKVKPLLEHDGKTAVQSDIRAGEQVVVEGQIRLVPGAPLKIMNQTH